MRKVIFNYGSLLLLSSFLILKSQILMAGNILSVGPTQIYSEIQPAIDAAQNGDLILVDPGVYQPFLLYKAISVASSSLDPTTARGNRFTVLQTPGSTSAITVVGIPSGESATIYDAEIEFTIPDNYPLYVVSNPGMVRLHNIKISANTALANSVPAAINIENSPHVWLYEVTALASASAEINPIFLSTATGPNNGVSAIRFKSSQGLVQNSDFRGFRNDSTIPNSHAGDGLRIVDSQLYLELGTYIGGQAALSGGHGIHEVNESATPTTRFQICGPGYLVAKGNGGLRNGAVITTNNTYYASPRNAPMPANCILEGISYTFLHANQKIQTRLSLGQLWNVEYASFLQPSSPGLNGPSYFIFMGESSYRDFARNREAMGVSVLDLNKPIQSLFFGPETNIPNVITNTIPNLPHVTGMQLTVQGLMAPSSELNTFSFSKPAMLLIQ